MSERKVLNKYFPPDFDPSKVPRMRKPKDRQEKIRLMAPFSMRCNTCGEYIYAGKKFNGRKEVVQGESYYGVKIFRLYIKCPMCSSEITFKTDPKNADYTVEHGVSRNFEPWRERKEDDDEGKADPLAHLIEEEGLGASDDDDDEDPMKALERRQQEAKREMEVMDALQDIRTRNARIDRVDADAVLQQRRLEKGKDKLTEQQRLEAEEDEALVQKYFGRDLAAAAAIGASQSVSQTGFTASAASSGSSASRSPETPDGGIEASGAQHRGLVKRARPADYGDGDVSGKSSKIDEDAEPDVITLLKARQQAHPSASSASTGSAFSMPSSTNGKAGSAASKRKKGTSAFGVVRKKA